MQFLAAYIMKGRMQAMTVAATLALLSLLLPPVSIVSSAAVALVTLRRGAREGLYVLGCACVAAAVLCQVLLGNYWFALVYGLVLWLPIWLIAIVLREGRRLMTAIEIAVLLGVLGVLGVYLFQPDAAQLWRGMLATMMQALLESRPDIPAQAAQQSAENLAHYMTGILAAGSVFGLLLGLFLGRWWQAGLYNPGGFRAEFLALQGRRSAALATALLAALAGLANGLAAEIGGNLLVMAFVLYLCIGTAVLHAAFAAMKSGRFMVPLLYATLLTIPHVMVVVALFGWGDHWLNLRHKFNSPGA